jgi:7-cyano-7-deazaguanine synthase
LKAVTLLSGGLDSTTLAYKLKDDGYDLITLSFDYGQRHVKELEVAMHIAGDLLKVQWHVIDLGVSEALDDDLESLSTLLKGSALTDKSVPVPEGHYAEDNMKITVVPNRNAIMLSIAYGVAVAEKADLVTFAAHSGDRAQYPDCTFEFVEAFNTALQIGNAWKGTERSVPTVTGPFLDWDKQRIAVEASRLGVPIAETWSCYAAGAIHCGRCGTCVERREAFELAGITDPTEYEDRDYWKQAVEEYAAGGTK